MQNELTLNAKKIKLLHRQFLFLAQIMEDFQILRINGKISNFVNFRPFRKIVLSRKRPLDAKKSNFSVNSFFFAPKVEYFQILKTET
jgi:hypothetical protein